MLIDISERRFVGLAIWFTAHTAVFSGLIFMLIPNLQTSWVNSATILGAIALIGPMQDAGARTNRFAAGQ